jgi:signal transduction histidine kinase
LPLRLAARFACRSASLRASLAAPPRCALRWRSASLRARRGLAFEKRAAVCLGVRLEWRAMQEHLLRFLPPAVRPSERDELLRAQLTLAGCWIGGAIGFAIAAMQMAWGIWESALAAALFGGASWLLPFWVRRSGRWRGAAVVLTALIWSASFAVAALTGGTMAPALYYLVFAAAVATVTLGVRAGAALSVVNTLVIGALYGLRVAGVESLRVVPPEIGLHSTMRGALVFNLALAALVAAYEWLRAAALRDAAQSERRYSALADYGPDLIAELDAAGRVAHISGGGAMNALFGGRSALESVHRDDRAALIAAARLLETQASVRTAPLRWLGSGAETRWFEASLTRFRARDEWRVLVVGRDVTARVNLEAQLRQSQKMQAVGQLASGLAHDFNNVLMVISGYAEMLAGRQKSEPEASAAIEEIQRASDRGAALTRRLLALSRPSALKRVALDLHGIVRDNEKMLRVLLGETVTLMLEVAPGEALVRADAGEIEQILVNLVANARDALPAGGTVRIASFPRAGRASLVVHDNGAGIEPALRDRIFEPFCTTKTPGQGAGLGLYVVYSIVSGLGGEIDLQSDSGAGTRVTVSFPLAATDARTNAPAARGERARASGERVLVVEERAELRELLRGALAEFGYQVVIAADGVEALALDVRDRIDLVVSDVVMPRMGGLALLAALRDTRPDLRALFLSDDSVEAARPDPRDRVLRKPFLIRDFQRTVRDLLDAP